MGAGVKIYCIDKFRNKRGAVVEYIMGDEFGNSNSFNRSEMVEVLKDSRYVVMNLQLDKLGRIVEKAIPNEASIIDRIFELGEKKDKHTLFDCAYGCFNHRQMVRIVVCNGKVTTDYPFDELNDLNTRNLDEVLREFEGYLKQKYGFIPLKLEVQNKATGWRYIMYGREYVDCSYLHEAPFRLELAEREKLEVKKTTGDGKYNMFEYKDSVSGMKNALLGVFVYDLTNNDASDWVKKQIADLEKKCKTRKAKSNKTSKAVRKGEKGIMDLFKR